MRQREFLEFRTPQHPSIGTNNWGGASPLLARDIPKESLEQRYLRLNSSRTRDEIFPVEKDDFIFVPPTQATKQGRLATKRGGRGLLSKLMGRKNEKTVALGSYTKKKRWLPRLDPQKRWPQGWC